MHRLEVPVVQTLIFFVAQVNLSARVRRQRTVQRTSPAGEAPPQQSLGFERIWNSSDDTEGAGSRIVMAMLFNTVIPLSIWRINALSSRSALFMCVWVCMCGGAQAKGHVSSQWSTQNNKGFTINYRSASKPLAAPIAMWGNFLCFTNNSLKTGKRRDAKNSVQGPDMTLQEILYFPPVEVQGAKRHFKEFTDAAI